MGELTMLLEAVRRGDAGSMERLVELTYAELHSLAHQRLRRASSITLLDTTSLVHECYLRLSALGELQTTDRAHFLGYASKVMRSITIDFARQRQAQRRGGDLHQVTLDTAVPESALRGEDELVRIDEALQALALLDERLMRVVEMKYFGGLGFEEIATVLGVTARTIRRDWQKARILLHEQLTT